MPSLSCLSLYEVGRTGSDSGNVVIPSAAVPFPISAFAVFAAAGVGAVSFTGLASFSGLFTEAGSSTVAFVGSSESRTVLAAAGAAAVAFVGTSSGAGDEDDELLLLLL